MSKINIGIDIGGTFTKYGLIDQDGKVLYRNEISSTESPDINDYVSHLAGAIKETIAKSGDVSINGIGIGAPNANYHSGTIEKAPNLLWKGIIPFADLLKEHFDLPIILTNDANAAALGEKLYGAGKGMSDFIVLTMGTGLGSGLIVGGELVVGKHGFAGELGHVTVNPKGRFCGCGKRGCLETYVSATGIKRTVFKLLADYNIDSSLRSISYDDLSAKMITEEAIKGDKIAIEAFRYTGKILGTKMADFIVHTDPEAIFLGGGLAKAGKHIFEPAIQFMNKYSMPIFKGKTKVLADRKSVV